MVAASMGFRPLAELALGIHDAELPDVAAAFFAAALEAQGDPIGSNCEPSGTEAGAGKL